MNRYKIEVIIQSETDEQEVLKTVAQDIEDHEPFLNLESINATTLSEAKP